MWASDAIKKFAVVGTSCSGKTTTVLGILHHLKCMGISCDGVMQQDRRFAFDRADLERYKEAQYYFICNQIMRETELTLRGHAEVIVSDRSVLDLYAYYATTYGHSRELHEFVVNWMLATYTALYYVKPLPYVDDKARPSDKFRLRVDKVLTEIIDDIRSAGQGKIVINAYDHRVIPPVNDAKFILNDILAKIGKKLQTPDLAVIPSILEIPKVLIGGSYAFDRATKFSDVDVYMLNNDLGITHTKESLKSKVQSVLGVEVDIHIVNNEVWEYLKNQGFKELWREYVPTIQKG